MKHIMKVKTMLFLTFVVIISSCNKKDDNGPVLNLSGSVNIQDFTVGGISASVDTTKGTVEISLPFGTDFSKVTPEIKTPPGATISPKSGETVDLTQPVTYQVINGNIYQKYTVTAKESPAILEFKMAGEKGKIDEDTRTIKAIVPATTDMENVPVEIKLADGASIQPESGADVDFTNPVTFTVTTSIASVDYTVTAINENGTKAAGFLGVYSDRNSITDPDEKAAADWFFKNYSKGKYISLNDVKEGEVDLSKFSVIWWHEDATQDLPNIASNLTVVDKMKTFHQNGGALLLTTFASTWIDDLGIVPSGKGPNNLFGDEEPNQSQDSNNWGISFTGHENHPLFQGLTTTSDFSYPAAYLLGKDAFRLNRTSWWQVDDWGGYGDAEGWRQATGGIDLAGPEGSETRDQHVSIAEFPKTDGSGNTIVITPGCYDWYAEPNPTNGDPSPKNIYLSNIKKLTANAIDYLRD